MQLLNQWSSQTKTRSGIPLNIRPASPSDRQELLGFLRAVSADDLRFRFLSAVKATEALARILTDVDHRSAEDLIAFDARDDTIAATAMIAQGSSPTVAEAAVMVRSDLKNHGIGWAMLGEACDYARQRGYERVECVESSSNSKAISLEQEQGFSSRSPGDNATLTILTKDLGQPEASPKASAR